EAVGYTTPGGVITIDSYFLSLTMELGALGLIAFLTLLGYTAVKAFLAGTRLKDEDSELSLLLPLAVSICAFLAIKLVFAQEDNHPIAFLLAAMSVGLVYRNSNGRESSAARAVAGK